jgi:hypothetical protein
MAKNKQAFCYTRENTEAQGLRAVSEYRVFGQWEKAVGRSLHGTRSHVPARQKMTLV